MAALSRRERVVIGAGAVVALVVGAHLFVVEPLLTRTRDAEVVVLAREAALQRRRLLIGQRAWLTEELVTVEAQVETESRRLLRGPTAPLAASELQKLVKDLLAAGNVEVRSERVMPATDRQGLQEVPIELTVLGSIRDTVTALARIEEIDRLLAVKDFKIRVVAVGQPRELITTLTVAGYLLPDAMPTRPDARVATTEEN